MKYITKARDGVTPNKKQMSTFKERLTVEKAELDDKLGKLKAFMESDKFNGIDTVQKSLLQVQAHAMLTYSQILFERIMWLEMPADVAG